ncbi:MAG: sigma-70 family RNA polymerase sigma factor [Marinoscillum sp.]|uniref:RNA polymerase sigma factor n=1 Tax=Marinoscillum sp. TaxID=2024838 RepID=UPI003302BE77
MDQLYRRHAGQLTAACSSYFGMVNLAMAEDMVQDTFIAALSDWNEKGIPNDPKSWLFKICKNKSLNLVAKQKKVLRNKSALYEGEGIDRFFLDHEIQDQQLRWLFATAIPTFSPRMRMIFMLRTLHGIRVREIATLLLLSEASVQKMYERARAQIKGQLEKTSVPDLDHSKERLPSVLNALYLIYTLGYDQPWQADSGQDLCYDALELTRSLVHKPTYQVADTYALYSLMLFQIARLPARISGDGVFQDLQQQDRSLWNAELIQLGIIQLNKSKTPESLSKYHLEATIASLHCTAASWASTPWKQIVVLYRLLLNAFPTPFIKLNLSIALLYAEGHSIALEYLKDQHFSLFSQNYQYHATLSRIYQAGTNLLQAKYHLGMALHYARAQPVKSYLQRRLDSMKQEV